MMSVWYRSGAVLLSGQCLYMLIMELSQCRDWITISNIWQNGKFYGVSSKILRTSEEKYSFGLRIFAKNTPLARNLGPKSEPRPLPEKIAVVNSGSPSHQAECHMKVSWKNIGSDIMTSHSIRTILYLKRLPLGYPLPDSTTPLQSF